MLASILEFLTIIVVCAIALIGGLFFFMFAGALISQNERESRVKELESEYTTRQVARNGYIINLLYQVGSPDLPSGHYSERKENDWAYIKQLQAEDAILTKQERDHLVRVQFGERS